MRLDVVMVLWSSTICSPRRLVPSFNRLNPIRLNDPRMWPPSHMTSLPGYQAGSQGQPRDLILRMFPWFQWEALSNFSRPTAPNHNPPPPMETFPTPSPFAGQKAKGLLKRSEMPPKSTDHTFLWVNTNTIVILTLSGLYSKYDMMEIQGSKQVQHGPTTRTIGYILMIS